MRHFYILLILFASQLIYGQSNTVIDKLEVKAQHGEHHEVLSIADSLLSTGIDDTLKVQLFNTKLYSLYVLERWSKFKKCIDASLNLRKQLGQAEVDFGEEYLQLNWYYQAIAKFDSAIYYGKKSIELTKHKFDRHRMARAYNLLGYAYSGLKDEIALPYYDSARYVLGEVKTARDSLILARWYHNNGNHLTNTTLNIKVSITYYDSSLRIYERFNDPSKLALNYYVRGYRYRVVDNMLQESIFYYKKAIHILTSNSTNEIVNKIF